MWYLFCGMGVDDGVWMGFAGDPDPHDCGGVVCHQQGVFRAFGEVRHEDGRLGR